MLSRILPLTTKIGAATFVLSAALAVMPSANAQILTQFTFGTVDNPGTTGVGYAPTTTATNITASDITLSAAAGTDATMQIAQTLGGLTYPTQVLSFNPTVLGAGTVATTPALAVSNNRYFSFSVTPSTGFQANLSSFTFDAARGGTGTPRGYVLRSSVDGFAANIATANVATSRPDLSAVSVPLTGLGFQNLTTPTTFRVYTYAPFANNTVEYDNVTLNGNIAAVAVPEASTMALLSLAGSMGAVVLARRRKK